MEHLKKKKQLILEKSILHQTGLDYWYIFCHVAFIEFKKNHIHLFLVDDSL